MMIITRNNVNVNGDACDVHARTWQASVVWCGVYVRPSGPVNGYWYFLPPRDATALLSSLGALPIGAVS
jgi:hypothetical protein